MYRQFHNYDHRLRHKRLKVNRRMDTDMVHSRSSSNNNKGRTGSTCILHLEAL